MKKMKIVWLCHFSNPRIREHLPLKKKRPLYHLVRKLLGLSPKYGQTSDFASWVTNGIEEIKKRNDVELHVICPQTGLKGLTSEFVLDGVHYYFYNPNFTLFLMHLIKNNELWRKLQTSSKYTNRFIKSIQPDIINLIGAENPYHSCAALVIKQNIPIMVSLQTIYTNPDRLKFYPNVDKSKNWYIAKLIHEQCRYFGATGRMHHDLLLKDNPNAIVFNLSWCSSELPEVKTLEKKFDFVNYAAHLSSQKGLHDSIRALGLVKKKYPRISLNLVGGIDSDVKKQLESLVKSLDLQDNVVFTPFFEKQEDMFQHIQKSRFAVLPCKMDIISSTMTQAMYYGLPLVVYKTTGTPQFNVKKECVLISKMNSIESLEQNMLLLLDNPEKSAQLKKNARDYIIAANDNKKITDNLIADYHAIVAHYHNGAAIPEELLFDLEEFPVY
jgi:glycosyltransferase involved in cell wall biosynthesis